jgi:hypothetical protein
MSRRSAAAEDGTDGPPGIFIMDCETFEILGRYEMDRGEQDKHYDFWWNLPRDYMVSSEWGLPPQFENGIVAEDLLSNKYGHKIHFWNLRERRNVQTIDLGANHQMALEIRPAHDPAKDYGFCGVVVDTTNLQGAIFTWWQKDDGTFEAKKTITIDPRPEKAENLPPLLQGFEAVPPLVTDIDLSLDDKYLYVACWGLGEMHQYDVSDPMNPKLAGKVEIGGIARGTKHPTARISPTARRWSRSAATASASTGPTRSTRHGTTSSIPMTRAARWSWPMSAKTVGWSSTRISTSSSRRAIAATRSGWKVATAPPTVSATRTSDADPWDFDDWTAAALWLAVVGSGIYHGINPGMGWPLAVSAGLMGRGQRRRHWRLAAGAGPPHGDGGDPAAVSR